ncbi:hypothetical protein PI124_g19559 [Phytophthora idaei]|nr:hypothetical protein PI125_g20574 [Phytophthora idaei]KAG3133751.1 hypothetical protein PI126_g19027 [Phytophthora idaei]KAG3235410.1 hypothetical protein PI124_g19559 [Phytophthora idaei]
MRSIFYVALAVAVLARSSVVAAFTSADESQLLSKTSPDFAADALISSDSRKRFLRVTGQDDVGLAADEEERIKWAFLDDVIERANTAETLKGLSKEKVTKAVKAAKNGDELTNTEKEVLNILKALAKNR